jgi:hypothetical protein
MEVCQRKYITPVHKKESKELAENYRQISLLSIVSKSLERCVSNNLYHNVSGLISNEQHGFISNNIHKDIIYSTVIGWFQCS